MSNVLPDWLRLWFQGVLLAEIYPEIRAIAVAFSDKKELKVRYYLDRQPTDFDYDSIEVVVSELLSHTSSNAEITKVEEECVFSEKRQADIDRLDGLVYARREYEMQDNPSGSPTYI